MGSGFVESLSKVDEVNISFLKHDGKRRTIPVWFVVTEGRVELLPMYGLKTKWFRDVEKADSMEIGSGKESKVARLKIIREEAEVHKIKGRFSRKYGDSDVRRYYPTSEVAVVAEV